MNDHFSILVRVSEDLRAQEEARRGPGPDPWENSPFQWITRQASRKKGAIFEKIIEGWCRANHLDVRRSPDSEADRLIGGRRVEIKGSTLWESEVFKFQQIRDQDYEVCICLGIEPHEVHCWVIPKPVILAKATGQHTGRAATDTRWLSFRAATPPSWLADYGGSLAAAAERLRAL